MSRRKKKRKLSQRQIKRKAEKTKRSSIPREGEYLLYEYEITDEPLFDAEYRKLPPEVRDQLEELHNMVFEDPDQAVPILRDLLEKYPQVPKLYNYLSGAYARIGENEKADAITRENYERNPDYLFAKCNFAEFCLQKGELGKIPAIFDNKFDLKVLYPRRRRFHVSEVTGFGYVIGRYFHAIGDERTAELWYDILRQVAPDDPATLQLKRAIHPSLVYRALRRLARATTPHRQNRLNPPEKRPLD